MANYSVWLFVVHVCWSLPGAGIVREKGESEDLASFPFQYAAGDETGIEWGYAQVAWTTTAKPEACPAPSSWLGRLRVAFKTDLKKKYCSLSVIQQNHFSPLSRFFTSIPVVFSLVLISK